MAAAESRTLSAADVEALDAPGVEDLACKKRGQRCFRENQTEPKNNWLPSGN